MGLMDAYHNRVNPPVVPGQNTMKKLKKTNIRDILALTPMQEGILFYYLNNPTGELYFEQLCLHISGDVKTAAMEAAWQVVVDGNEMLRTVFRWEKMDKPVQVVLKSHKLEMGYFDLAAGEGEDAAGGSIEERLMALDKKRPFDLREVPFRVTLYKTGEKRYIMLVSNHHIIYDGWSNGILLKELFDAYGGGTKSTGSKGTGAGGKGRFKSYIQWLQRRDGERQKEFWRDYLKGVDTATEFALKRRPADTGGGGKAFQQFVPFTAEMENGMERFAKERKITLAALLYGAWGLLLHKYNNSGDVLFGTTVSGRSAKVRAIEEMVGLFINTLPLRSRIDGDERVGDWLDGMDRDLQLRREYENTPLVDINRCAGAGTAGLLFDTVVVIENYPLNSGWRSEKVSGDFNVDSYSIFGRNNYDLTLSILTFETLQLGFSCNGDLYGREDIAKLAGQLMNAISGMIAGPGLRVIDVEVMSADEKRHLLVELNITGVPGNGLRGNGHPPGRIPSDCEAGDVTGATIPGWFEAQVEKNGDGIALVTQSGEGKKVTMTYRRLNEKADKLAALCRRRGVKRGVVVGVLAEPSQEMIVGILAILKAGGGYLPLEPSHPGERLEFMLADSCAPLLLTQSHLADTVPFVGEVLCLDDGDLYRGEDLKASGAGAPLPGDVVYVIYTSGTTGKPKGAVLTHKNLVNYVGWFAGTAGLTNGSNGILTSSFAFDLGYTAIYPSLLAGGQLHLVPKEICLVPEYLLEYIKTNGITYLKLTPSLFSLLVNSPGFTREACRDLSLIVLGGEAINVGDVSRGHAVCGDTRMMNHYGPTEATIGCIARFIDCSRLDDYRAAPTIGRPIANTRAYILDRHCRAMPRGINGELYIGGDGVAMGYLNNPELTAARFIENPYVPGERLYRTGDVARWMADGNILFRGRVDNQVKMNGFRVELGEIEALLLKHEDVKEAVVLPCTGEKGEDFLCAYIAAAPNAAGTSGKEGGGGDTAGAPAPRGAKPEARLDRDSIRHYLSERLPHYMIPASIVPVNKIPLTANGKIDRKRLPAPGRVAREREYAPPGDDIERALTRICADILGVEEHRFGIDDDLLRLGSHSINALLTVTRVHKELDVKLPLSAVFPTSTIRKLATHVRESRGDKYIPIEAVEERDFYPLSSAQKRLFIQQQLEPGSRAYNMPGMVQLHGAVRRDGLEEVFRQLIKRHDSLRTSFGLIDGVPVQRVRRDVDLEVEYHSIANEEEKEGVLKGFLRPFDLSRPPLLRVGLVSLKNEADFLMVDMHHIISDGLSRQILIREFSRLYRGSPLPPLTIQYKDFAHWQNRMLESGLLAKQETYWLDRFRGNVPELSLPTDFPRKRGLRGGGGYEFTLSGPLLERVRQLALEMGTTLYMFLLAVYTILLSKYADQEDIVVGAPVYGRNHADLQPIIGMFVNMLALRNFPVRGKRFDAFLKEVAASALDAYENQDYQFERLVWALSRRGVQGREPAGLTIAAVFVMENLDQSGEAAVGNDEHGLTVIPLGSDAGQAKFDLVLGAVEEPAAITLDFEYDSHLFKGKTIEGMAGHLLSILEEVVANRDVKLVEISMISEEEKKGMIHQIKKPSFGGDAVPGSREKGEGKNDPGCKTKLKKTEVEFDF